MATQARRMGWVRAGFVIVVVGVFFATLGWIAQSSPSVAAAVSTQEAPDVHDQRFESPDIGLAFSLSGSWTVVEQGSRPTIPAGAERFAADGEALLPAQLDGSTWTNPCANPRRIQLVLQGPSGEGATINVYAKDGSFESWLQEAQAGPLTSRELDLDRDRVTVNGTPGYLWSIPSYGHDRAGHALALEGERFFYLFAFPDSALGSPPSADLLASIVIDGRSGPTILPNIPPPGQDDDRVPVEQTCCNETDAYHNTYPCCPPNGNCTWKCEARRAGSDNFYFTGPGTGRDAYRWMSLEYSNGSGYAQGGTIPRGGAVLVALSTFGGGLGHVATVKSVNTDGSVTVIEQNCGATCSRTMTYGPSWFIQYLAGFIYKAGNAPAPTAKPIAGSGETMIEDFNYSNVYHFQAYGPGSGMSFNSGERAWGIWRDDTYNDYLHFIRSKSGPYENYGRWRAQIVTPGLYEIQAWIPNSTYAGASSLVYNVNGKFSAPISQAGNRGRWVKLANPGRGDGYWNFPSAGAKSIFLADSYASAAGAWIAMDALKFVRR